MIQDSLPRNIEVEGARGQIEMAIWKARWEKERCVDQKWFGDVSLVGDVSTSFLNYITRTIPRTFIWELLINFVDSVVY